MAQWVRTHGNNIPDNAIRAGYESDGKALYVAKAMHQGEWTPGKAGTHIPGCHLPFGGKECIVNDYEVLVYNKHAPGFLDWRSASGGYVPDPNSAFCLHPTHAYYIARAHHAGCLIPGKLHTSHGCTYVSYAGQEVAVRDYEVLCRVR